MCSDGTWLQGHATDWTSTWLRAYDLGMHWAGVDCVGDALALFGSRRGKIFPRVRDEFCAAAEIRELDESGNRDAADRRRDGAGEIEAKLVLQDCDIV